MKRNLLITVVLLALLPGIAKAQWTFDIVSVEAYINDHKKQRSLLLARSTLEYSNKLLHEYSRKEVGGYKELNVDLDRYTRAFDIIDVMYQSLRTARLVIGMGFIMSIFFALVSQLVILLPGAPFWDGDNAFRTVFGAVPRATIASLLAFIVGSNINALVMSRMKVKDKGSRFGLRAIVSSLLGEFCAGRSARIRPVPSVCF